MPFAAVVVNPVGTQTRQLREAVRDAEASAGWEPSRWFETTADDPGGGAARAALATRPEVLLVAGGDGTVRAVAEEACEQAVPLGIIPTGTGNLLARNLRLPLKDVRACVTAGFEADDRAIDVVAIELELADGSTSSTIFLAMAGVGLDAAMARNSDHRLKALVGWIAYVPSIASSILRNRSFHLRHQDERQHGLPGHVHTMIVGNCGVLTGDMVLLPNAVVDDGLMDVVILKPGRLIGWAPIGFRLALNGQLYRESLRRPDGFRTRMLRMVPNTPTARYRQTTHYEVHFEEPQLIELDGDAFDHVIRARFEIRPRALRLRVPETDRDDG